MIDEAKRCVEALRNNIRNGFHWIGNAEFSMPCKGMIHLIESLAAELEQVKQERDEAWKVVESVSGQNEIMADVLRRVKRERDAAVKDVERMGEYRPYCETCLYVDSDSKEAPCHSCYEGYLINNWQWRGAKIDREV